MSDQARKKAQKRLKRDRKRQSLRRAASVSPYKRIAHEGELLECWANDDWIERGQAAVYVLRRGPDGTLAFASFFIDLWCAGLKDAWGRLDVLRDEFEEIVDHMSSRMDDSMAECDLEEAAEIVAGAIRFAMQNGFRLPPDYKRWTAFLGELDVKNADLTDFGKDGGLLWVGPLHDLRDRLIGSTIEVFLDRPDVHFISDADDQFVIDEDEDYGDEAGEDEDVEDEDDSLLLGRQALSAINGAADRALEEIECWLQAKNEIPSKLLRLAVTSMIMSSMASADADGKMVHETARLHQQDFAKQLISSFPGKAEDFVVAMNQINSFLASGKLKGTFSEHVLPAASVDAPA